MCFLIRAHFVSVEQLQQIFTCLKMHMGLRGCIRGFLVSGSGREWLPGNAALEGGPLAVLEAAKYA